MNTLREGEQTYALHRFSGSLCPNSMVTLVRDNRQWLKARLGIEASRRRAIRDLHTLLSTLRDQAANVKIHLHSLRAQ